MRDVCVWCCQCLLVARTFPLKCWNQQDPSREEKPSNGAHIFHVDWRQSVLWRDEDCLVVYSEIFTLVMTSSVRRARTFEHAQFMVIWGVEMESDSIHDKCVGKYFIFGISFVTTWMCPYRRAGVAQQVPPELIFWHSRQMRCDREEWWRREADVKKGVKCQSLAGSTHICDVKP